MDKFLSFLVSRKAESVPPEVLESIRRHQLGVPYRMLDILVPQVVLDRSGIPLIVGQLVPTGMTQHVRVQLEVESDGLT
jgi:hypothetical protein